MSSLVSNDKQRILVEVNIPFHRIWETANSLAISPVLNLFVHNYSYL